MGGFGEFRTDLEQAAAQNKNARLIALVKGEGCHLAKDWGSTTWRSAGRALIDNLPTQYLQCKLISLMTQRWGKSNYVKTKGGT